MDCWVKEEPEKEVPILNCPDTNDRFSQLAVSDNISVCSLYRAHTIATAWVKHRALYNFELTTT